MTASTEGLSTVLSQQKMTKAVDSVIHLPETLHISPPVLRPSEARQTGALPSPLASHIHVEVVIPTASHRTNSSIAVDVGATSAGRG